MNLYNSHAHYKYLKVFYDILIFLNGNGEEKFKQIAE
jgi:hypothetical protein